MYLEKINSPADVKKLSLDEKKVLAEEMRASLLKRLSIHGGHFGPNFGMVEATIALHTVFNSPNDKFVFDVSHQSYCHKMLTGRKDAFMYEDKYDEVSGYSAPVEGPHDHFIIGHTSTSLSLASGLAKARNLVGGDGNVIAIIGDGSLSGGEALEGLDYIGEMGGNFIIVFNDNQMSIAENHGGIYKNLAELRSSKGKCSNNLFKAFGLDYIYVDEGNDIQALTDAFLKVKDTDHPVVVHINTLKGKGYKPAETDKENWHWCMPFDIKTGKSKFDFDGEYYDDLVCDFLLEKMKKDKRVVAITAGTPTVFGFTKEKREQAGDQFVDVGIAEEHAVALSSGIAKNGGKPVFGVNSTFLQRAYDQISQDVCVNNSSATFVVFSASVYGMRDVTHLGIYDIPMLSNIPNLVYLAPTCKQEFLAMLDWSIEQNEYPVAIRVPGNDVIDNPSYKAQDFSKLNKFSVNQKGEKVAIIAEGTFYELGEKVAKRLEKETGIKPTLINPVFLTGIDEQVLEGLKSKHSLVITLEDGSLDGGFGGKIASFYGASDVKVINYGIKKAFYDRFDPDELLKQNRLDVDDIVEDVKGIVG